MRRQNIDYNATMACMDDDGQNNCSCNCEIGYGTGLVLIIASFFGTCGFWGFERVAKELDSQ